MANFQLQPGEMPAAQLTVFDASNGDCNLVDFCLDPANVTRPEAWLRTLIDTGPYRADIIRRTVVGHIVNTGFPRPATVPPATAMPQAVLNELVVTHHDDDHSGNATAILNFLADEDGGRYLRDVCRVIYSGIPDPLYPDPFIKATQVQWYPAYFVNHRRLAGPGGEGVNVLRFDAVLSLGWRKYMTAAGFVVSIVWDIPPLDLNVDGAQCFPETGIPTENTGLDQAVTFVYRNGFTPPPTPPLVVSCRVTMQMTWSQPADGQQPATTTAVLPNWGPQGSGTDFLSDAQRHHFQSAECDFRQRIHWVTQTPPPTNGGGGPIHNLNSNNTHGHSRLGTAKDLASLRATIGLLNKKKRMGITEITEPRLGDKWPQAPRPHQQPSPGHRVIVGPPTLHRDLFRQELILWSLYADARGNGTFDLNGTRALFDWKRHKLDIVNQASIMTLYQRHFNNAHFAMFFTGDAYDSCLTASADQVMGLIRPPNSPPSAAVFVNVLKIPHHGSGLSSDGEFYRKVLADVYIISAGGRYKSKHPGYNVMEAILKTFTYPARDNRPHRPVLFFSEPEVDKEPEPNIALTDCFKPGNRPTELKYEMYKLAKSKDPNFYVSKGMVQFVQDANGIRYLKPDPAQWIPLGQ